MGRGPGQGYLRDGVRTIKFGLKLLRKEYGGGVIQDKGVKTGEGGGGNILWAESKFGKVRIREGI